MASRVASNGGPQQAQGSSRPGDKCPAQPQAADGGASYANALLKLNSACADFNKENINVKECTVINKMPLPKASQHLDEVMAIGSSPQDEGESFTTVTNHHSRKERKSHERQPERQSRSEKQQSRSEKQDKQPPPASSGKQLNGEQPQASDSSPVEKKVFVEAPIPKVNPWQAKRTAAQLLQPDKRVLQPQRQEISTAAATAAASVAAAAAAATASAAATATAAASATAAAAVAGPAQPSVVRASKDRRKYNVKVS